jgi:hypothetical protein
LVLQIRSSPFEHCFFGPNELIFSPKQVPCRFSLNLPLFGLGPSSKGLWTNLKLSTNKIAWIHWSLELGPSLKSPPLYISLLAGGTIRHRKSWQWVEIFYPNFLTPRSQGLRYFKTTDPYTLQPPRAARPIHSSTAPTARPIQCTPPLFRPLIWSLAHLIKVLRRPYMYI